MGVGLAYYLIPMQGFHWWGRARILSNTNARLSLVGVGLAYYLIPMQGFHWWGRARILFNDNARLSLARILSYYQITTLVSNWWNVTGGM